MICKYCSAELEEDVLICPVCGKSLEEQTPESVEETVEVETTEDPAEEIPEQEMQLLEEDPEEQLPKSGKKKLWVAITAGVVALAILAGALLYAFGAFAPVAKDITDIASYGVSDEVAAKKSDKTVAVIGDTKLTNGTLQAYYWSQVYDFLNYYGTYYFDINKPLSEQVMDEESGTTWEQYFLEMALSSWQRYTLLSYLAQEDSAYTAPEDLTAYLNNLPEQLKEVAAEYKFDDVDAFIQSDMGAGCFTRHYVAYMDGYCRGLEYFNHLYEVLAPTQEEIEEYYSTNEAAFAENDITKDSGLSSDVRHILIMPKGGAEDENGTVTYSDAEWQTCYEEAEKVLQEWKNGEATEESFAELTGKYTEDTGYSQNGGLYQGVNKHSNYVTAFRDWATDTGRQEGDAEIVRTEYGYHIMYYVTGEPYWISSVKTNILADRTSAKIDEAAQRLPMDVNYNKIALADALSQPVTE